jgi:ankyrin repeat protein
MSANRQRRGSGELSGFTPLHYACASKNAELVEEGLRNGIDPNIPNIYDETCLHVAAQVGCSEIVKSLITAHADPNKCNNQLQTPLFIACRQGHCDIVKELLDAGADQSIANVKGKLAYDVCRDDRCRKLLTQYKGIDTCCNAKIVSKGLTSPCFTPLMLACVRRDVQSARTSGCSDNVNAVSVYGDTALHMACESGNDLLVLTLIQLKADISIQNAKGLTPFELAHANGFVDLESRISRLQENLGTTGSDECVESGSRLAYSPLQYACASNNREKLDRLLNESSTNDINHPNVYGDTALHYAARNASVEIVKKLLDRNADINAISTSSGDTPIMLAIRRGNREITCLLAERGADLTLTNKKGVSSHDLIREKGMVIGESRKEPCSSGSISSFTPLMYACVKGDLQKVTDLIESKQAIVTETNVYGDTGLSYACLGKSLDLVKYLLEQKSDVNATNTYGDSALHMAVINSDPNVAREIVQELVRVKADVHVKNHKKKTPLEICRHEIVKNYFHTL